MAFEPSRYTVTALQPVSQARRKARSTSSTDALLGRLMVLETEFVTYSCHAACILTWASGLMSMDVRNSAGSMPCSASTISASAGESAMRPSTSLTCSSEPRRSRSDSHTDLGASRRRSLLPSWSFHSTFDHQALAKWGSMPLEQSARRLIVPVGAMVTTLELRTGGNPRVFSADSGYSGKGPRSAASRADSSQAVSWMNLATSPVSSSALCES